MVHERLEKMSGVPGLRTGDREFHPGHARGERALIDHEMERVGKGKFEKLVR